MFVCRPLACLGLLVLLTVHAAAADPKKVTTVEGISEYRLENGLQLLLMPDNSQPKVTVNLTILVGSRHEGYGEGGMAHLLEHLVFKGTPTHPHPPKALRDRGASFNGTTWVDRTNYFETLPASDDNLEFSIRLEADRMVNSFIRREDLLSEMTVVRNEFERGENSPEQLLEKRMLSVMYEWHGYGRETIGNRSDIERVPIDRLQEFYRRYYQPDNAVLIVAGKFDQSKAVAFTQKYFGAIPRPDRKLHPTYTQEPPQDGDRMVNVRRVGDVAILKSMYHIPAGSHEDYPPLQVLATALSMPPSGRLYKDLVESKKATSAYAGAARFHDPGYFEISAQVPKENSLDDARDTLLASLETVIADGLSEEEVERARQVLINTRRRTALNTSAVAVELSNWVGMGDWRLYFLHRDRLEKVTAADVKRVAARYLVSANRTVGYFIPSEKPELVPIPSVPDVKEVVGNYQGRSAVAGVEEFDYDYAKVESRTTRTTLSTGIKAALLPKPTRDEQVQLSLTLRFGDAKSLQPYREAALFLPELMERGTQKLSFQQFRDELTRLDVSLSASPGPPGRYEFGIRARRSSLAPALDLLRQMLREPKLDPAELEILRRGRLSQLEQARSEPAALAGNLLTRTLNPYPPSDIRYAPTPDERIALVKAVTIDQVREVHEKFLSGQHGELVIVGDFDQAAALAKMEEVLSGWEASMPYARIERQVFKDVAGGKHSINTPDKANANFLAGLSLEIDDRDPDYPPLLLGNVVLGGSALSSRLGDRVRQKEGLSYGVGSYLIAPEEDKAGQFAISAICNPLNVAKVEAAVREELDRLLKEGIPEEEFEKARRGVLETRLRSRTDDAYVVNRLERSLRVGQTLAYEAELQAKLAALTPSEVSAAFKKRIDPKRLVVVAASDLESKRD